MDKRMNQYVIQIGDDSALNIQIQNHAMTLGYSWEILFDKPKYTDATKLWFTHKGFIYRNLFGTMKSNHFSVISASDFLKLNKRDVGGCGCRYHNGENK